MNRYSLDADVITRLLKKHPGNVAFVDRFREEIRRNASFVICPVVFFARFAASWFSRAPWRNSLPSSGS